MLPALIFITVLIVVFIFFKHRLTATPTDTTFYSGRATRTSGERPHSPPIDVSKLRSPVAQPPVLKSAATPRKPRPSSTVRVTPPQTPSPSPPASVRNFTVEKTGGGGAWKSTGFSGSDDFDEILALVRANPHSSAKAITWLAQQRYGYGFTKTRVNSALYRLWHRGLVEKSDTKGAPRWWVS